MPRLTALDPSNDNLESFDSYHPTQEKASATRLRLSVGEHEDPRDPLSDTVLAWLHDSVDGRRSEWPWETRAREREFESSVVSRLFPIHDTRTPVMRLRDHSRATALAARVVVDRIGLGCGDQAFAVGWLHDMGLAAQLRQIEADALATEEERFEQIWPSLLRGAGDAAAHIAYAWRLPTGIRCAIQEHKSFSKLRSSNQLAAATFVAEHLAGCMGCGFRDEQPTSGLRVALSRLRLTERDLAPLGRGAERLLAREAWYWMGALPCAGA
ncbi:MAG: HDOD domain-containing protein [Myxococcales bacterium]